MINNIDDLCPDLEYTTQILQNENYQKEYQELDKNVQNLTIKKITKHGEKFGLLIPMDINCYKLYLLQIWQKKRIDDFQEFIFWKQKLIHLSILELIYKFQNKLDDEFQDYIKKIKDFEESMFKKFDTHYTQYDLKKKIKRKIQNINNMSPTNLRMISEAELTVLERSSVYCKKQQQQQQHQQQQQQQANIQSNFQENQNNQNLLNQIQESSHIVNDEHEETGSQKQNINILKYDFKIKVINSEEKHSDENNQPEKELEFLDEQEQIVKKEKKVPAQIQTKNIHKSKFQEKTTADTFDGDEQTQEDVCSKINLDFECSEPSDDEESPIKLPQNFNYKINTLSVYSKQ